MNRMEELRQEVVAVLDAAIQEFEQNGNPELDGDFVTVNYITAKRTLELLKQEAEQKQVILIPLVSG